MKSFENICKMTQPEVKKYMKKFLISNKYDVVDQDGFLYAKGTVPVLLVAHMDTVHRERCKTIVCIGDRISSPQGIGGDDRCGVFIIMNLVKELHCSVLLCEDEEVGCVGAHKFVNAKRKFKDEAGNETEVRYIDELDVNYMIELDRKGNNDAVFYSCDNKEFISFVEDATNYKFAYGSVSDISVLMPEAKLSAVNLSCGYYNAHTLTEYVLYDEMMDTVEAARALIKEKCDKPFEYIKKKYTYIPTKTSNYGASGCASYINSCAQKYYGNLFEDTMPVANTDPIGYMDEPLANVAMNDKELELEAIIYDEGLSEKVLHATGETKADCWMALFLENPSLCFNDIVDYSWG
jgi:hypothetical protein